MASSSQPAKRRKKGSRPPEKNGVTKAAGKTPQQTAQKVAHQSTCRFEGCSLPREGRSLYCPLHLALVERSSKMIWNDDASDKERLV